MKYVLQSLKEFCLHFNISPPNNCLVIGKFVYLVSDDVKRVVSSVSRNCFSAGLCLGKLSAKGFVPSFVLLDLLKSTENNVVINDGAEWLFVCGRDVFEENIAKKGRIRGQFLVINSLGEVLGLGKLRKEGGKSIIINVLDRGDFLRRESNSKKGNFRKVRKHS